LGEVAYGYGFRPVVDFAVIALQMAVCTIYFSLMSVNVASFLRTIFNLSSLDKTTGDQTYHSNDEGDPFILTFLANEQVVMTLFLLPVCLGLSSLSNLKVLAPYIAVASFLMFATFFLISIAITKHWNEGVTNWKQNGGIDIDWAKVPLAACAIMYSLEGDQLILPIEAAMHKPVKYFQRTLIFSLSFICCLFCMFGSFCVIAFGHISNGSITADLQNRSKDLDIGSASNFLTTSQIVFLANLIVSISLLFTYPLQLYPILGLTGQILSKMQKKHSSADSIETPTRISDIFLGSKHSNDTDLSNYGSINSSQTTPHYKNGDKAHDGNIDTFLNEGSPEKVKDDGMKIECDSLKMRFSLVFLTYLMAMVVPHLELLISLGGALTGSMTSIILPPLIALKFVIDEATSGLKHSERGSKKEIFRALVNSSDKKWILIFSSFIGLGLVYGIIGTWYSLKDLIKALRS